jgi:hypothetical protein
MRCKILLGVEASFMEGQILVFIIPLIQGSGSAAESVLASSFSRSNEAVLAFSFMN